MIDGLFLYLKVITVIYIVGIVIWIKVNFFDI